LSPADGASRALMILAARALAQANAVMALCERGLANEALPLLRGLADLDTPDDLVRFVARRALTTGTTGRRTEAALRAMGLLPPAA
ncbi:MAG: hypothetical protein AAB113_05125, partial [Candidatus Eisenbacteria bacterium]